MEAETEYNEQRKVRSMDEWQQGLLSIVSHMG